MTPGLLLDVTQIPDKLAGLQAVVRGIAVAMLAFIIPFTIVEMNVRGLERKEMPSYSGFFARVFTVAVCLLCYQQLYYFILKVSQIMSFAILSEAEWGDFLNKILKGGDSRFPTLSILFHSVTSIQQLVLFASTLVAVTVRDVVVMLQGCFLSLLYAFGPIAIVCGINQRTGQVTRGWLANSFQVAFWSFFLRLVMRVWLTLGPIAANSGGGAGDDYLGMLTVNVTFILLVLGTPIVSARLLSGENLAAFGEAALGAVQAASIVKTMRAGSIISSKIEGYRRDKEPFKSHIFHHPVAYPVAATMTALGRRIFQRRPKAGDKPA